MKKIFFTFILLLFFSFLKGQVKNYFGGSFSMGYRSTYNLVGIAVQARLLNHIDLDLGGSLSFFNGVGYSGGVSYVPLNTMVQPFFGIEYGKSFGGKYGIAAKGENTSFYQVSPIEFVYLKGGLMYKIEDENQKNPSAPWFFSLTFSYRKAISNYNIEHTSGPVYNDEKWLNSRMDNGIGFSISLIVLFGGS